MLPRPVVRLPKERRERSEGVRLHEGAQPAALVVDVREAKRADGARAGVAAAAVETAAADARVGIRAYYDNIAWASR